VARVRRAASGLADDLRRIARDVHPRHIDELGLDAALRSLVRETCSERLSDCTYQSHGRTATPEVLTAAVANALYDAARESLQNTRRHSGARRVNVSLGVEQHAARLSVIDDGCGFHPESLASRPPGGLELVRERMALLGGTLEILSQPGKGTHIVALVPIVRPAQSAAPRFPQPEGV
jgi:two-component system, NarL family, sensor kinase